MSREHKLGPIEHWIVDGKAYRLATCDDVGKEVLFSRRAITESRMLHPRPLIAVASDRQLYRDKLGEKWGYAYVQDDSLLTPQRTPVPGLGDGWCLLTAEDGEFREGDKITASMCGDAGWIDWGARYAFTIRQWLLDGSHAARYFGPAKEPQPKPIDWTKPVRTKDGRSVRVLRTDGPGDYPVVGFVQDDPYPVTWTLEGRRILCTEVPLDLENAPERLQKTWWMNVFKCGSFDYYETKEQADADRGRGIFACVAFTIDCEEGAGL